MTGNKPEIWRADTGASEAVSYRIEGGETVVSLEFGAEDSFFVVFREPDTTAGSRTVVPTGRWPTSAAPGPSPSSRDAAHPASSSLGRPSRWARHSEPAIKYFSGVSTWTSTFGRRAGKPGAALRLDLGEVGDVAEVRVNGKAVGTVVEGALSRSTSGPPPSAGATRSKSTSPTSGSTG